MQTLHQLQALRAQITAWRQAGERIALVPTMGNLHRGHLTLVEQARQQAARVVVSIFVNPMQFGEGEDLDAYPRTLEQDCESLQSVGADLVFAPAVTEVYPEGLELATRVAVPELSSDLCGAFRPGHFEGVATVVAKLFNMVQPDVALFGEKDFQQLMVIRRMAHDLNFPIEILGVPTVREADGLAMSSRNGYLSKAERVMAPMLYQRLQWMAKCLQQGERDYKRLSDDAARALKDAGFKPDYIEVRRAWDLSEPGPEESELVILGAAYLGRARLIDNLSLTL